MGETQQQPSPTGINNPEAAARLIERVEISHVRFINLEFTDVVGLPKSITIPVEELSDCLDHGKWVDGSAIEAFARVAETDMYLRPDIATYAEVPWRTAIEAPGQGGERVARLVCDVLMPTGERFPGDPRGLLIDALEEAASLGYRYELAPELEFFLLRESANGTSEPLPHDRGSYFDLSTDLAADVRREIVAELGRMNIRVESTHHEVAAGQHELDFAPAGALDIADAIVTTRYAIKAIAQRHGLTATFLPKPFFGVNGSGMHTHQRLTSTRDGVNLFSNPADQQYGLSQHARHFIAGQLAHAPALTAIVAPLVNSYKRLVSGFEAPVMISWGRVNREALVRRTASSGTRGVSVELRSPDPSCNPYLAFAVMLRAGLDGIARELPLPAPVEEGLYMLDEQSRLRRGIGLLPSTLGEALAALQADDVILEALNQQIATWFIEAKTQEWNEFCSRVHPWELERYWPAF
jgi:glutamine synthetase